MFSFIHFVLSRKFELMAKIGFRVHRLYIVVHMYFANLITCNRLSDLQNTKNKHGALIKDFLDNT